MQSSYILEDSKSRPLNPSNASLNESLQTQFLDLDEGDQSALANVTRSISKVVGSICTPRQVLGLLRVLKAITLCFLVLTILSDLMYIIFVELVSSDEVKKIAGSKRDTILRLYGLAMCFLGLAIELDYSKVVKKFSGLKGFLPRACLYYFIAQITGSHPVLLDPFDFSDNADNYNNNYNNNNNNDDQNDNAAAAGDDGNNYNNYNNGFNYTPPDIPKSVVGFQRICSFVVACCAVGYLFCGLLCFDRFTARAFLSNNDPRLTTAVPASSAGHPSDSSPSRQHQQRESTYAEESATQSSSVA